MSIDVLQDKIRKLKNPAMVDLALAASDLPCVLLEQEGSDAKAYGRFCMEMLENLKTIVPAVRVCFTAFALMGPEGLEELTKVMIIVKLMISSKRNATH